jgi:dihydrofolate synthase/folylpolyglutamate synthase
MRGLNNAKWSARFEKINTDPTIFFDGAHNSQGIRAAVESIKEYFSDKKVIVITGVLRDKDYHDISSSISEISSHVFTITPNNPRALSADDYSREFHSLNISATPCLNIRCALLEAIRLAKENNNAIFCLGSLYTYGDVISSLGEINKTIC